MGAFLAHGGVWTQGYQAIAIFQVALVAVLLLSLPLWRKVNEDERADALHAVQDAIDTVPERDGQLSPRGGILTIKLFFTYESIGYRRTP